MLLNVAPLHAEHHEAASAPTAKIGAAAPGFTLTDAAGAEHSLSDFEGKYVVLEWINFDCPFVKRHYGSHGMQSLQERYTKKDVVWLTICSSAPGQQGHFTGDALKVRITKAHLHATAYLQDPDGDVGRMYGAKTTPHMFVIDPEGTLIYDGAIDDQPRGADASKTTNYVVAALDASMAGKPVEVAATKSYGCSVKYAK